MDAEAFSDCTGMYCRKSPGWNAQRREPLKQLYRFSGEEPGNVLWLLSCAKKVTRPPGRDPALVGIKPPSIHLLTMKAASQTTHEDRAGYTRSIRV